MVYLAQNQEASVIAKINNNFLSQKEIFGSVLIVSDGETAKTLIGFNYQPLVIKIVQEFTGIKNSLIGKMDSSPLSICKSTVQPVLTEESLIAK